MPSKSLQALKQVAASMAGLVPGVSDENRSEIERHILRILSGTGSQVLGLNEQGEPELGKRPGIIDEMISFPELLPPLLEGAGWLNKKTGLGGYGDAQSRLAELVSKYMPDAVGEASDRTDRLHKAVREGLELPEAHGFTENAEDALGVMAGQLPVPAGAIRRLTGGKGSASKLAKTVVSSPLEWLSPTIDPSVSNYLSGAGFGGGMGALEDSLSPPVEKAEGGRVDRLTKMLKALSMNPEARKGATQHLLDDPMENVKYASHEAVQSGKLSPEDQTVLNSLIEKYLNGDQSTTDEMLGNRLIDLHQSLFGSNPLQAPQHQFLPVKIDKTLVPGGFGTLKSTKE